MDLPGRPRRDRRLDLPLRRGHQLLPARAPADGVRDVVVGAPLHLPRAVPVLLAPDRHGRVVRRASGRALLVDGAVARDAGRGRRCADRPAGLALAAPPRPGRRRAARGARRRLDRPAGAPARPAAGRRRPVLPVAVPAPRAVVAGASRTRSRRRPSGDLLRITVKDLGDHSARPGAAHRPARAWPSRAPTAASPPTPQRATACCSSARESALPRSSRCCRSCRRRPTSPCSCARRRRRTSSCATRSPARSSGAAAASSSSSAPAAQVRLDAHSLRKLVPDLRRREVYLCGPDALAHQLTSELERAGVPQPRIHFESFAS